MILAGLVMFFVSIFLAAVYALIYFLAAIFAAVLLVVRGVIYLSGRSRS